MGQFIISPWEGRIFNRTMKMGIWKKYYALGVGLTPAPPLPLNKEKASPVERKRVVVTKQYAKKYCVQEESWRAPIYSV